MTGSGVGAKSRWNTGEFARRFEAIRPGMTELELVKIHRTITVA
jgi:hypothetical protein